jgi:23S rRNA (pseudouridine1915-N3)-methyltransferase
MKLRVISVGSKSPAWIRQGFDEYAKRMPKEMALTLIEVAAPRHHQDSAKIDEDEAKKIAAKIQPY